MLSNNFINKIAFSLTLLALTLSPIAAKAQVRVSPLVIQTETKRGQAESVISITNTSDKPSRIRVYAEPFTYSRDTGLTVLPANNPNNLAPYLQFSPRELTIQPGQTRRVRAISRLAPNLPDGEYRAVIYNESLNESSVNSKKGVNIITRIGVTFFIIKGNASPQLAVTNANFNAQQKRLQLLVSNIGKASARPKVNWALRRGNSVIKSGSEDATTVIAQGDRNILLNFTDKKNESFLTPGAYQLSGELIWGENKQNKLPFNLKLTIPASSATSQKK